MNKKSIKVSRLKLWDENPRFPQEYFRKKEEDLINYLFKKKGEKEKIIELANSIINNFDLPPWEKLIVYQHNNNLIVLEGNRRIAVYKILLNPNLVKDKKIKKLFIKGKEKTKIESNFSVDCLVTKNQETGLRYVEMKHLETGYKGWGESERNNFKKRRGMTGENIIIKTEIDRIVRGLDIPEILKEDVLGHGYVTTFYRIISSMSAKNLFGYEIKEKKLDIKDKNFLKKLKVIIWDVVNKKTFSGKKLNSRTMNNKKEIKNYLRSIDNEAIKVTEEEIKKSLIKTKNLFGKEEIKIRKRRTKREKDTQAKIFGDPLFLKKGDTNSLYLDIIDLFDFYNMNKNKLSNKFSALIRMSLRLLVDCASDNNIDDYVNNNFYEAKNNLSKNNKTTLKSQEVNTPGKLISLLQIGAHNYSASSNVKQTIAMSKIIREMLKITHSK